MNISHTDQQDTVETPFVEISSGPLKPNEVKTPEALVQILTKHTVSERDLTLIQKSFTDIFQTLEEWKQEAAQVPKESDDPGVWAQARKAALSLVKVRTGSEAIKKKLKADSLAFGRTVDAVNNFIDQEVRKLEEPLRVLAETGERKEAERLEALKNSRKEQLVALDYDPEFLDLAGMPQEQFDKLVAQQTEYQKQQKIQKEQQEALDKLILERGEARLINIKTLYKIHDFNPEHTLPEAKELGAMEDDAFYALVQEHADHVNRMQEDQQQAILHNQKVETAKVRGNLIQKAGGNPDIYDLLNMSEPVFNTLLINIQNTTKEEADRKATEALRVSRTEALARFNALVPANVDLAKMDTGSYADLLQKAEFEHIQKQAQLKEAEDLAKAPDKQKLQTLLDAINLAISQGEAPCKHKLAAIVQGGLITELRKIVSNYQPKVDQL